MCLELCKKYNLDETHVKELRKNVAEIRSWGHHVNAFYELLHDQIQLLHADKSYVEIEKSGVLKELGQKIQLSHISRLVGEFLIPKEKPTQFYAPAPGREFGFFSRPVRTTREILEGTDPTPVHAEFRGMGVYVRCWEGTRLHIDFPKVVKALKYFKIQFWDERKEESAKMIMEIMAEPDMGPIDDPVMEPGGLLRMWCRSKCTCLASQGYFKQLRDEIHAD